MVSILVLEMVYVNRYILFAQTTHLLLPIPKQAQV
jgi:hypothetical protein